ncbi:maleylpyruvate isomerase N-terminal domain-containing protein [Curtobacterium sp. MCBD17_032]|uniref:maleylpyruvate isomerase N-terminal domain-containing protein n=1 Tax=Curtobacterium sp. MCBD17_032 TaxID=2175659 RepID=UPI000DAA11F4|nr:maleylpyruvate isomerase N-terminal domain-containing protein [Curtobacterium sp. MCBD17_032]PZE86295.1 hypothetical protein DEI91_04125 [Curtobacterium sp. MCBD17_032]
MDPRALFAATAQSFVDLIAALPSPVADPVLWSSRALGVWDLRALVGHTNRALVTVSTYATTALQAPQTSPTPTPASEPHDADPRPHRADPAPSTAATDCTDAAGYLRTASRSATDPDEVAARGVTAGAALGADPETAVATARDQALAALAVTPPGTRVAVVGGLHLPVEEYLRTRVVELVVHGGDIARAATAAGTPVEACPPEEAVVAAAVLLAEIGAHRGDGPALLAALTGRGALPAGYSVL